MTTKSRKFIFLSGMSVALLFITAATTSADATGANSKQQEYSLKGIKHRVERLENELEKLSSTEPLNIFVDCSAGEKIQDAINENSAFFRPINITIQGLCVEAVNISRDYISLNGSQSGDGLRAPSPDTFAVLEVQRSKHVSLSQLTLQGGQNGLHATNNSDVHASELHASAAGQCLAMNLGATAEIENSLFDNCYIGASSVGNSSLKLTHSTISNSQVFGVSSQNGGTILLFDGSVVTNSGFHGVYSSIGGTVEIRDSTIETSTEFGVHADSGGVVLIDRGGLVQTTDGTGALANTGGAIHLRNGARIANNYGHGITGFNGGDIKVQDESLVEGNTGDGINLITGSTASIESNSIIQNNGGSGVSVNDVSVATFGSDTQIINNGGIAIVCAPPPAVAQITGSPGTISGNGSDIIQCP